MPRASDSSRNETAGAAAVDRALAIVLAMESTARPISLADIARATGMYKSTLLRLLASLVKAGLVARRADQTYVFGSLAFRLGRAFDATYHLKDALMPALEWLVENGTESASFHIWKDSEQRVCVFRVDSNHSTLDSIHVGDFLPMKRGAPGKVLRAFAEGERINEDVPLVHTSFGERDPACAAIACPVFGASGELLGAVSLSGPRERFTDASIKRMEKLLLQAASMATQSLGGHPFDEGTSGGTAIARAKAAAR